MANEKKAKATEKKVDAVESTESTTTAEVSATTEKKLVVEREKFTAKDGREMWGYAVHGNIRGRDVKVDFNAYDQGGYEVLDMVFDIKDTADLLMREESMSDGDTGEVRSYTIYEVANKDSDGDELRCRIKPARDSDKSILAYLLKKLNRQTA